MRRILTVEDTFLLPDDRGSILSPPVTLEGAGSLELALELRRPDGSRVLVEAVAHIPHFHTADGVTPAPPEHTLLLPAVDESDVPVGTEVWLIESENMT